MARQKSAFLSALGIVFQIWKTIVDSVMDVGGGDDDLRKILADKDLARNLSLLITGKASGIVELVKTSHGFFEKIDGVVVKYHPHYPDKESGNDYRLGQQVKAESVPTVEEGTLGWIVGINEKAETFCQVLDVAFCDGHHASVRCKSSEVIKIA